MFTPPLFQRFQIPGFFSFKLSKGEILKRYPDTFFPRQTHSDKIIELKEFFEPLSEEADGVLTRTKGLSIGVQTADCVPILVAHKRKECVSAVHAGWRGTLSGILGKAIERLLDWGCRPEDLLVALGPHIQGSCYEVKEEVLDLLDAPFKRPPFLIQRDKGYLLNLKELNLHQAKILGVPEENLWASPECTHCLRDLYHSFRRERNYNYTQVALIYL